MLVSVPLELCLIDNTCNQGAVLTAEMHFVRRPSIDCPSILMRLRKKLGQTEAYRFLFAKESLACPHLALASVGVLREDNILPLYCSILHLSSALPRG